MQFRDEWGELEHPEKNTKFLERDNLNEAMQLLDDTINSITSSETSRQSLTMAAYVLYNTACKLWYDYHIKYVAKVADENNIVDNSEILERVKQQYIKDKIADAE